MIAEPQARKEAGINIESVRGTGWLTSSKPGQREEQIVYYTVFM